MPYENLSGIADVGEAIVVYGLDRALGVFGSVQFAASSATYGEGDGATPVILTRSGSAVVAATIDHARSGGTATPGTDFTYTAGSEAWSIGDDGFETYSFFITQDTLDEPNETIVFGALEPDRRHGDRQPRDVHRHDHRRRRRRGDRSSAARPIRFQRPAARRRSP